MAGCGADVLADEFDRSVELFGDIRSRESVEKRVGVCVRLNRDQPGRCCVAKTGPAGWWGAPRERLLPVDGLGAGVQRGWQPSLNESWH